jgi:hypothetical protein
VSQNPPELSSGDCSVLAAAQSIFEWLCDYDDENYGNDALGEISYNTAAWERTVAHTGDSSGYESVLLGLLLSSGS